MFNIMSSKVELDEEVLTNYINSLQWLELTQYLKDAFRITRNEVTGEVESLAVSIHTINLLSSILKDLANNKFGELTNDLLVVAQEIFRSLRNCTVFNLDSQNLLRTDANIFSSTKKILLRVLSFNNECTNVILQFLINIVAGNLENVPAVWQIVYSNLTEFFIKSGYFTSALLYNIIYLNKGLVGECQNVYSFVLDENENEYKTFLLEIFIQEYNFMKCYDTFDSKQKLIILSSLTDCLLNETVNFTLSFDIVELLSSKFKAKSDCILKTTVNDVEDLEPREVVLLLDILSSLSSQDTYQKQLQSDQDLIINCVFLLKSVQSAGKESQNRFTPIQKLSEITNRDSQTQDDPVYGFKAILIRFIGNIAWKNKYNQDKLRELDCIPLLLDCCNIDARNPLIIQWNILAIRNICDNNPINQEMIAGMTKRGVVNSSTLQEMGLTLQDDGVNKITLLPYSPPNLK